MSEIIDPLKEIHKKHRLVVDASVSEHTKSAQTITSEWQNEVCKGNIEKEVKVSNKNRECIDIVDFDNNTAYELKVSGNNTPHEFYKDVCKVLTYNINEKIEKKRIKKLFFISESVGIKSLHGRLDCEFLKMLHSRHGLEIELIGI